MIQIERSNQIKQNEWRSRARDRSIDRTNDRAFVAFLVRVPPVEREVARRRVTIDRSVGTRPTEPNRTNNRTGRDGTGRAPGRSPQGAKDDGQT